MARAEDQKARPAGLARKFQPVPGPSGLTLVTSQLTVGRSSNLFRFRFRFRFSFRFLFFSEFSNLFLPTPTQARARD